MNLFEEAEYELGLEEGELEGTFPTWLVMALKMQSNLVDFEEEI